MPKLTRTIGLFFAATLAACVLPAQQGTTTNVTIRVTDSLGAVIPHAKITLVPAPDPVPLSLETDDHGERGIELRAGPHDLSVSARGFKTYTRHIAVKIPGGQFVATQFVPVTLEIGHSDGPYVDPSSLLLTADPYQVLPVMLSPADFRALPHVLLTIHNGHTDGCLLYTSFGLHRCHRPAPFHMRRRQQVIGAGEFGIPLQCGAQVDHHVGQTYDVGVLRLR